MVSELFWLSQAQFDRIKRYFPRARGTKRIDDFRVVSGIIHVIKNGMSWRDAPLEYGSHTALYLRFMKWSQGGVFNQIFAELAADGIAFDWLTLEATGVNAQRTAVKLAMKGMFPAVAVAEDCKPPKSENFPIHSHYNTKRVLKAEMQDALEEIAATEGCSVRKLCNAVHDLKKPTNTFATALRIFIVEYYRSKSKSVSNNEVSQVLERIKVKAKRKKRIELTAQERTVAKFLVEGITNPEIAEALGIKVGTVKMHVGHIFRKVGAQKRTQVALCLAEAAEKRGS